MVCYHDNVISTETTVVMDTHLDVPVEYVLGVEVGQPGDHLPEHVAHEWLCHLGTPLYELKEVEAVSMLLHHQLEVALVLIGFQQLEGGREGESLSEKLRDIGREEEREKEGGRWEMGKVL